MAASRLTVAVVCVAVVSASGTALAERTAPKKVSAELGGLKWGVTKADVISKHQSAIEAVYAKRLAGVTDPLTMDRLRRERDDEVQNLARAVAKLEGKRNGYEVSVIEGEFKANAGEEVFVAPASGKEQRYYLFRRDALVKVVVVHKLAKGAKRIPFTMFIDDLKRDYGRPRQFEYAGADEAEITGAEWSDGATRMTAKDKADLFLAYTVVLSDEREQSTVAPPSTAAPKPDEAIEDLFRKSN